MIKKYEAMNSKAPPDSWLDWNAPYDNEIDRRNRFQGDDYSFVHYAGHLPLGIKPVYAEFNAMVTASQIEVPVFMLQGAEDILTSRNSTARWFETLEVSPKTRFVIPEAAHDFNEDVIQKLHEVLTQHVPPLVEEARKSAAAD